MATVEITEYYVEYFKKREGSDTTLLRYTSRNFSNLEKATEFSNSMLSQGAVKSNIVEQRFYYEK